MFVKAEAIKRILNKVAPFNWVSCSPRWTVLAGLGRSKVVSTTILMPIIGYFLFFNDQVVSLISLSADLLGLDAKLALQRSLSSLRILYIGLGAIAVASALFKLCCPSSINETGTYGNYINTYLPLMDTFTLEKLKKDIKSSGACSLVDQAEINEIVEYQAAIDEKFIAANPQNLSQLSIPKKTYDAWMNENRIGFTSVLRARFQQEDCSRAWGRCFVTVFYAIGIGFVLFPSIRMFVTIVTAVMHTPISQ